MVTTRVLRHPAHHPAGVPAARFYHATQLTHTTSLTLFCGCTGLPFHTAPQAPCLVASPHTTYLAIILRQGAFFFPRTSFVSAPCQAIVFLEKLLFQNRNNISNKKQCSKKAKCLYTGLLVKEFTWTRRMCSRASWMRTRSRSSRHL